MFGQQAVLAGPEGWGTAVAIMIDREFIPKAAVNGLVEEDGLVHGRVVQVAPIKISATSAIGFSALDP